MPPSQSQHNPSNLEDFVTLEKLVGGHPSSSLPYGAQATGSSTPSLGPRSSLTPGAISLVTSTPQLFTAPSFQYEQYRQQSSLPVGAVADTYALNEADTFFDGFDMLGMGDGTYDFQNEDFLGMGALPSDPMPMNTDFIGAPTHQMEHILGGVAMAPVLSDSSTTMNSAPPPPPAPPVRAWPGMHQQQAAMQAKAQAEARAKSGQGAVQPGSVGSSRTSMKAPTTATDPLTDASISRVLHRMRHGNQDIIEEADVEDRSEGERLGALLPGRSKKDEEDMDEDERLLASEEGKRLTSKERRQLRNKVSARAFRSRRKEYIGQLEGELATVASQVDELRSRNDALSAENNRLTDLTRMLLSSPHFSSYLNELSANGGSLPQATTNSTQNDTSSQQTSQQRHDRKDPDPSNYPPNNGNGNMHVRMASIPESIYEDNSLSPWASGGFDQQVYAARAIPDEPCIDSGALTIKKSLRFAPCNLSGKTYSVDYFDLARSKDYVSRGLLDSGFEIVGDKNFKKDLRVTDSRVSSSEYKNKNEHCLPQTQSNGTTRMHFPMNTTKQAIQGARPEQNAAELDAVLVYMDSMMKYLDNMLN